MFTKGEKISVTYICGESENFNPITETLGNCVVEEFSDGLLKVKATTVQKYDHFVSNEKPGSKEQVREYIFNVRSPIFAFSRK